MRERRLVEHIWYGETVVAAIARTALAPAEALYRGVMRLREVLYETGSLSTTRPVLPTISVGNVRVGGTGKTPVAAWLASELLARGARPAIVLRGYGADEPRVHEVLNPEAIVVVDPDRAAGIVAARDQGATVAVLDDAFQHRRVRRDVDLVLVSADRWRQDVRLLPAGPLREGMHAITRASLVIVTAKAAAAAEVDAVNGALAARAPRLPRITVRLVADSLRRVGGDAAQPIAAVAGRDVRVLTAIADPESLAAQLRMAGARVTVTAFPDHHAFREREIATFLAAIPEDVVLVCTLKDAVKLEALWPRAAPPLWYVSQRVSVERGVGGIERVLDTLIGRTNRTLAEPG